MRIIIDTGIIIESDNIQEILTFVKLYKQGKVKTKRENKKKNSKKMAMQPWTDIENKFLFENLDKNPRDLFDHPILKNRSQRAIAVRYSALKSRDAKRLDRKFVQELKAQGAW